MRTRTKVVVATAAASGALAVGAPLAASADIAGLGLPGTGLVENAPLVGDATEQVKGTAEEMTGSTTEQLPGSTEQLPDSTDAVDQSTGSVEQSTEGNELKTPLGDS